MRKKIIAILLMLTMASFLILTGCNSGNNETQNQTGAANGNESKVTDTKRSEENAASADSIILFQSKVEITDRMQACLEAYEEQTGVHVEFWSTTGSDYFTQLKTKLSSNQGPTIYSLIPGSESEQLRAYQADLSELSFADKIFDGYTDVDENGHIFGIPYTIEGYGLIYNENLFDASAATDTDSLIRLLSDLKAKNIYGLGLSQEGGFLIKHILTTPFNIQEDAQEFLNKLNNGEVSMAETEEFQEFARLYEAIREYSYNPLEVSYDQAIGHFAMGKSASIHQGDWCFNMFADYEMDFEMKMAPVPLNGNDKITTSIPIAWYVNSQASEEEQQAAKEFIEWLYTSETGIKYLMEEFRFIPIVEGMESNTLSPLSQEVMRYVEEGKTNLSVTGNWPAGIVANYLTPVAQEFFTTDMTGEQLLNALDEAWIQANQ